jgi:hypothetical protein
MLFMPGREVYHQSIEIGKLGSGAILVAYATVRTSNQDEFSNKADKDSSEIP